MRPVPVSSTIDNPLVLMVCIIHVYHIAVYIHIYTTVIESDQLVQSAGQTAQRRRSTSGYLRRVSAPSTGPYRRGSFTDSPGLPVTCEGKLNSCLSSHKCRVRYIQCSTLWFQETMWNVLIKCIHAMGGGNPREIPSSVHSVSAENALYIYTHNKAIIITNYHLTMQTTLLYHIPIVPLQRLSRCVQQVLLPREDAHEVGQEDVPLPQVWGCLGDTPVERALVWRN